MSFSLNNFRAALTGGGARPTLFKIFITNPIEPIADIKLPLLCKATSLPASNIDVIKVPHAGRTINVKGDRTYEDWTVTIINDEDFAIRHAMERWHEAMNTPEGNTMLTGSSSPASYQAQGQIQQFSQTGVMLREYTFDGLMPLNISAIDVGAEMTNAIEEFQVTFAFNWWKVTGGVTGTIGN